MSRITDYILEPNVVYTNGSFLIKVKVQDSYKYKKILISENMKYTTATGTTFTLTNAVSTNNASILQLQGNTSQNGTPTPTSPVDISTVSGDNEVTVNGSNFLDIEKIKTQTWTNNVYKGTRLNDISPKGTWYIKAKLKEGKTAISGLYVSIAPTINPNASTNAFAIRDGDPKNWGNYNTFTGTDLYLSFYPTSHTIEEITEVYDLWISKSDTTYEPYTGNSYRVDLGGKNLLSSPMNITNRGVAVVNDINSYFSFNGTGSSSGNINNTSNTFTLNAGTYTFSIRYKSGTLTTAGATYIRLRNSSGDAVISGAELRIINTNYNSEVISATFTIAETTTMYLSVYVVNTTVYDNLVYEIQLEKRKYSNKIQSLCI